MNKVFSKSRRNAIKSGAAVAALSAIPGSVIAAPKKTGEIKALFLVGDVHHGSILQEHMWREVLEPAGWRLRFAQSAKFVTPEELSDTDLFVLCRYAGGDTLGFSGEKFVKDREPSADFMTDELEAAIIANVNRGMGFLATHCTIYNPNRPKFLNFIGAERTHMHGPIVQVLVHQINQEHPITKGIQPFETDPDEAFSAIMTGDPHTPLFNIKQTEPPLDALGGWCKESGKGRIVVLFPGHNSNPYVKGPYKTIMWRSAHWALNLDIPQTSFKDGYKCGSDPVTTVLY